jgi:aldehyde dehydrogenase (NAD+)
VLKPASDTPASAAVLAEAFLEAGLPDGVLNIVFGPGNILGNALINHPDVQMISFTGSSEVGKLISTSAGQQMKRCAMEMGGKNAQIIMDDANLNLAVEGALWGAFGTTGQRCTATSRLIVHKKVYDDIVAEMISRANKLKLGNGLDAEIDVGPLINEAQLMKVATYVGIGENEGARLMTGGQRDLSDNCKDGWFYRPTIFVNVELHMRIAQEEIFGPVLGIMKVNSLEEALEVVNNTAYGLSCSIYTKDIDRALKAANDTETGITYINSPTIGAEAHLPFGGLKATGNGHREGGWTAYDMYTEWKTVFIDYSGRLQKAQIIE